MLKLFLFRQVCDKFYFCVDGVANQIVCPETLIFDPSKVVFKAVTERDTRS